MPQNKELKLTKPEHNGASQLNSSVRRTVARAKGRVGLRNRGMALIGCVGLVLTAGTCDRYYALRRTVSTRTVPDSACVENAIRAANVGSVTHSCRTDADTGDLRDYYRIEGSEPHEWVTFSIPRGVSNSSVVRLNWGRLNQRPSAEQTARIRRMMTDAYAAAQGACPGLPDPEQVRESCDWCK